MREIRFRGFNTKHGWVHGDLHLLSTNPHIHTSSLKSYPIFPYSVGQFTGLKDKNGKDIYEGDVFIVNGKYPKLVRYIEKYACFCLANIADLDYKWMNPWQQVAPNWWNEFGHEIEIIGNEHDNPEWLNP